MILYSIDHSLYCAKLRLVLRHKGLNWEERDPPGGVGSQTYLALVPSGNLPALVDGNLTLTDSEAIAEYLEEKHPQPAMLPNTLEQRAWSRQLSRFSDTRLEPALRVFFAQANPAVRVPAQIAAAHAGLTRWMGALETLLKQNPLPQDHLWLGDCGLIITLDWIDLMEHAVIPPLQWGPHTQTYRAAKTTIAAVATERHSYQPHMEHWMQGKGAFE